MGSLETGTSFKKVDSKKNNHPQTTLRSLSSSRIERQHSRPRSRILKILLPKKLGYLQWVSTIVVFSLLLALFQLFLPGFMVVERQESDGALISGGDLIYLKDIIGLLDFGEDVKFEPRRVLLPEFREEVRDVNVSYGSKTVARIGQRKPQLALVFPDLEVDSYQITMATVTPELLKLGYLVEVFSEEDGPAHSVWLHMGVPVTIMKSQAQDKIAVDWLNYDGILVNSLEAKGIISCLMLEPFKSLPLIWTVHEKTLAARLTHYSSNGKTEVIKDWRRSFNRATVVVFQDLSLPMFYSKFDSGNYFVIPAPAQECESGHSLTQNERTKIALNDDDFVITIVGSPFLYKGMWLEHSLILQALMPLLTELSLKVLILTGDTTQKYTSVIEAISAGLRYPKDVVTHVAGDDANADDFLKASNLVMYGSFREEESFPNVLIKALCFGKLVVAPHLSMIEKHVDDKVNGYLFPKEEVFALTNILLHQVISNGKLSPTAANVALTGEITAKNLMASEAVECYISLLENILQLPSEVAHPKPISEISSSNGTEWNRDIFSVLIPGVNATHNNRTSSSLTYLDYIESQQGKRQPYRSSDAEAVETSSTSLYLIWAQENEIQAALASKRREEEELKDRSDQTHATWEDVYRNSKRADRLKNVLHERDDGELERTGQPLTIYEPYYGEGAWPFLHDNSLYRGIGLSTRERRPGRDDINAPSRLPLLSNVYYRDLLGEFGAFLAIAYRIDRVHKNAWIGFQSWRATARNASLSRTAENALLKAIQNRRNGDTLYFWMRMDLDPRNPADLDFWSFCDSINAGNCRSAFSDAFNTMYGIDKDSDSLPPMPVNDGGTWSSMHSWALPTKSFLEFVMFSRIFVDAMDAQMYDKHRQTGQCGLSLFNDKHCYSRVLELLVNVWAYHSARKMVYINPETGVMSEQHPLRNRRGGKMRVKWFAHTMVKSMDEDLAEEADSDRSKRRRRWLWPMTGEVFWQGMYEKERHQRQQEKMKRRQQSRDKLRRMRKRVRQKVLGVYVKPPPEEEMENETSLDVAAVTDRRR